MASSTELYLPSNLPYPVKILSLALSPQASIDRGTNLLNYSYTYVPPERNGTPEVRYGSWESPIEGTVDSWKLRPGDHVSARRANEKPVLLVTEPCKHGIQLGGLCCLCGKDMTASDYTGFSDTSRASIQMTHSANGPTVSLEEAQRIERETADHLLTSRKLSLIVDLDQTIVHATVDPTVGEWIVEGELWEARQSKKDKASHGKEEKASDPEGSGSDDDDAVNPNWEALKDVKKFRLGPEAFGAPQARNGSRKGKERAIENEGCLYYVKPRPGWHEFLRSIATKYEMHVYTMGTRAYAEEVCAAIDPDGKLFAGRILSRDESGSLTQKSLQRLFPCDTSMVVIIDDRADVWEWSPNLVKVIPYDFFIGIGDINSAFLPKISPLTPTAPTPPPTIGQQSHHDAKGPPSPTLSDTTLSGTTDSTLVDKENNELIKKTMLTQNSLALEAQVEERPLAKKQEELQASPSGQVSNGNSANSGSDPPESKDKNAEGRKKRNRAPAKALLRNDDFELIRVKNLLDEVHTRFYEAFDAHHPQESKRSRKKRQEFETPLYDVKLIIPNIRMSTFDGVHMLFSSVIPLDTVPESTEIWRTAQAFGARCHTELSSRVTHVVAAKRGTAKVDAARRINGVKVVWLSWFTDSLALWSRQDETPYLMDDPSTKVVPLNSSPILDPNQISSDPEPDADDWDQEITGPSNPGMLELNTIDWDDINDEVEAAMNESDSDEDTRSERSGMNSGNISEDDLTDDTASVVSGTNAPPKAKRKRLRSLTPSEIGMNGNDDVLRSPLAKRKKLSADRSGASKLKEAISAKDLQAEEQGGEDVAVDQPSGNDGDRLGDEGDSDEAFDIDDDFLARELEEELG